MEGEREQEEERQRIETEKKKWENRTEEWLCDAAMRGDIGSLYEIINTDSFILYKVCMGSFKGRNPLHVAISTGQGEFALKLLDIEPDLAEVLDTRLGAALHLASAKGYVEIVKALVKVRPKMCLARDRDGNNPFHIAAMEGQEQVLEELVQTSLRRAQVKADQGDTVLHLCVKYDQFHCLKLLLGKIPDPEFVNASDTDGNTILHLAVWENQVEMVELVLTSNIEIDVNAINKSGRTALDIHFLAGGNSTGSGIERFLLDAGAKRSEPTIAEVKELEPKWQAERRNALLVVASLISTMLFQVAVNPPGGVFQDNSVHVAGKSIYAYNKPSTYRTFTFINTFGLLASLATIILLVYAMPEPERSHRKARALIVWFAVVATADSYLYAVLAISPEYSRFWININRAIVVLIILWFALMAILLERSLKQKDSNGGHGEELSRSGREAENSLPNAVGGNQSYV